MNPLVRVVVLNHNGGDITIDCLRSVLATRWPAPRLQVVLVDNASSDAVVARVRAELPVVRIIESERNLGFAGGCNLGMRDLKGADYVALVNNDALVDPGWLTPLVDALERDPGLGAACPKVVFAENGVIGNGVIDNVGVDLGRWGRGADRGHLEPDHGQFDVPVDVFAWCGAAVLLRRAYLEDVGTFDERLFLYCEDLDLAWRGRGRGWRYRTAPTSVVHHMHSATTIAGSPLQRTYNMRNALLVALRHAPPATALAAVARSFAALCVAVVRRPDEVSARARAFTGFLRLAPAMIGERAHERTDARAYSRSPMDGSAAYAGVDNLDVMAHAVKFSRYMRDIVVDAAGPLSADARLLDFGAGTGTIAEQVAALGYQVTCLEPDLHLQARLSDAGLPVVADAIAAKAAAPFDVVYSVSVIEHIEDDVGALTEIRELLRPGGKLVIFVPAFPMLYSEMDRRIGHFRRYRRKAIMSVVERAGFVVDRGRYVDSLGFFGSLVYKLFGDRNGEISEPLVRTYDRFVFPIATMLDPITGRVFGRDVLVTAHRT